MKAEIANLIPQVQKGLQVTPMKVVGEVMNG